MQFKNEKEATGLSRRHFTHIVWVFDLMVLGHNYSYLVPVHKLLFSAVS